MKEINFLTTKSPFPADDGQKIPIANLFSVAESRGHICKVFLPSGVAVTSGFWAFALELVQRFNFFASFYDRSEISEADVSQLTKDSVLVISPVRLTHHGIRLAKVNRKIKTVLILNDAKWPMYLEALIYGIGLRAGGNLGDLKKGIFLPIVFIRELFAYRKIDLVVVQTEREKRKLYGAKKVAVCTNAVEKPDFAWQGSESKVVCLQVNLESRRCEKWRPFLTEIWPKINKRFPEFTLELFGPGDIETAPHWLKNVICVEYVGRVSNVDEYLSKKRVLVMPLEHATGISNTVLRGLSMQMPMIISSTSETGIDSLTCNKDRCYVAKRPDDYLELFAGVANHTYPEIPPIQIGSWVENFVSILEHIDEPVQLQKV